MRRRSATTKRRVYERGETLTMHFLRGLLVRQRRIVALVLKLVKPMVNSSLLNEFGVGTHFAHLTMMKHDNSVRIANSREAMGDDQAGAILHHFIQRILDE